MGTIAAPDHESALSIGEATVMQRSASADRREDEREEREIFSRLEKPRVRYDVEVVTKIIVYAGKQLRNMFLESSVDPIGKKSRHCMDRGGRKPYTLRGTRIRHGTADQLSRGNIYIELRPQVHGY